MDEKAGKIRLVKCPKCENLLPERADFSVYQCGGCGAVLRAKDRSSEAGGSSENSPEERTGSGFQRSGGLSEKGVANVVGGSNAHTRPDNVRQDRSSIERDEFRNLNGYKDLDKDTAAFVGASGMNKYGKGLSDVDMKMEVNKVKASYENMGATRDPEGYPNWLNIERNEAHGIRNLMNGVKNASLPSSSYSNEGPSSYQPSVSYGYKEQTKFNSEPGASCKVEYLEQNRADLLKKLDELKDQLRRSCEIAGQPKVNAPMDRKSGTQQPLSNPKKLSLGRSSMTNRDQMQFTMARDLVTDPPYMNRYPDPYTYSHRPEMVASNMLSSICDPSHFHVYMDPYESHLHGRPMPQVPGQYNGTSRPYISGQNLDSDPKRFEPYSCSSAFHHPSCTCFLCHSRRQYVPPPIPLTTYHDSRFRDVINDPMFYHRKNHPSYTSRPFKPPSLSSHDAVPPLMGGTSDFNSGGSLLQTGPQRTLVASGRLRCYPVAGGAPFISCCNCFELLHLPERVPNMYKTQQNLRCGACSAVICYTVINKKLIISVNLEKRQIYDKVNDRSSETIKGTKSDFLGHMNHGSASYSFNNYDNSGFVFESLDRETALKSSKDVPNSSKQHVQSHHSSSSSMSINDNTPDVLLPTKEEKHSSEQPVRAPLSPPPAGSPLQEYFDYSNCKNQWNQFGKGNQSSHSDHENQVLNKVTTHQNSVKEATLVSEMDVSYNEYSNTGVSQDSRDSSRKYDQHKLNKGSKSLLNVLNEIFSKPNQAAEDSKASVSINGHPISDQLIKTAEKLAGPVRPGHYWYDYRAGFWGVMGGSCLGIIPPFIEEFSYPLSADCAGGDTGVYVNGRELHHKDLDLLISRGLPAERDRSYTIEISGRVWDVDTGEELDCLGKLAPTIEKVKHGFGMKVPRVSA